MGVKLNKFDQMKEFVPLKNEIPEYAQIPSSSLQDIAKRVDRSFVRFFNGAGYPKFKKASRYNSITFYRSGCLLRNNRIKVLRCGEIKVKWSRPIYGDIKVITIKRSRSEKWFVSFLCEVENNNGNYNQTDKKTGIDLGIECLVTTSDGDRLGETKFLKKKLKYIKRIQRHLSKQQRGSKRRKKTVKQLAKLHEKVANQRLDMQHKITTKLVKENAEIHCEDINPSFLTTNKRFSRQIYDVAWGQFLIILIYKMAIANRSLKKKNPQYTSQECSGCGKIEPKALSERWHTCSCGVSLHRDHNAAIVILNRKE